MSYEYNAPPGGDDYKLPNSNMAIVSLIAGILGLTFFPLLGSIAAVITGSMARNEIRESAGTLGGDGMAIAGLAMGWIGISIISIALCSLCAVFGLIPLLGLTLGTEWVLPGLLTVLFNHFGIPSILALIGLAVGDVF